MGETGPGRAATDGADSDAHGWPCDADDHHPVLTGNGGDAVGDGHTAYADACGRWDQASGNTVAASGTVGHSAASLDRIPDPDGPAW